MKFSNAENPPNCKENQSALPVISHKRDFKHLQYIDYMESFPYGNICPKDSVYILTRIMGVRDHYIRRRNSFILFS